MSLRGIKNTELDKRIPLGFAGLPLEKPFSIQICISAICNLRCEFCCVGGTDNAYIHSIREKCENGVMDMRFFRQIVDDTKGSFGKVKQILLTGNGEPLLNKNVAEMVSYIKTQDVAERIDLLTNGVGLTHKLSEELVAAGLSLLRISLNGLSNSDYMKFCKRNIDYNEYVDQIKYFYSVKKDTKVYIKIINYMIDSEEKKEMFYKTFEPISDIINIENLYDDGTGENNIALKRNNTFQNKSKYSDLQAATDICTPPFYMIAINEDGSVRPCCGGVFDGKSIIGNVKKKTLLDLWNNECFDLQCRLLDGVKNVDFCKKCTAMLSYVQEDDILDPYVDELKKQYKKKKKLVLNNT